MSQNKSNKKERTNVIISILGKYKNYNMVDYKINDKIYRSPFVVYPIYEYISKNRKEKAEMILLHPESLLPEQDIIDIKNYDLLCKKAKKYIIQYLKEKKKEGDKEIIKNIIKSIEKSVILIMPSIGKYKNDSGTNILFHNNFNSVRVFLTLKMYTYLKELFKKENSDVIFHIDISHGHNQNTLLMVDIIHNLYVAYKLSKINENITPIYYYSSDIFIEDKEVQNINIFEYKRRVFRSKYDITPAKALKINDKELSYEDKIRIGKEISRKEKEINNSNIKKILYKMKMINYLEYHTMIPLLFIELLKAQDMINKRDKLISKIIKNYLETYWGYRHISKNEQELEIIYRVFFNEKNFLLDIMWLNSLINKYVSLYQKIDKEEPMDLLKIDKDNFIISWNIIKNIANILYGNDIAISDYINVELNNYSTAKFKCNYRCEKESVIDKKEKSKDIKKYNNIYFIRLACLKNLEKHDNSTDITQIVRNSTAHIGLNANFTYYGLDETSEKIYFLINTKYKTYRELINRLIK